MVEAVGASYISSGYRDAIAFAILILVLVLRPQGILGKKWRTSCKGRKDMMNKIYAAIAKRQTPIQLILLALTAVFPFVVSNPYAIRLAVLSGCL